MRAPWLLLPAIALSSMALGAESPVAVRSTLPASTDYSRALTINPLQRKNKTSGTDSTAIRDPFMIVNQPVAVVVEQPTTPSLPPASPATASFSAFRLLGKQQDDEGWSVFIGAPGKSGQVWVVREGETFDENYRVSKLAPPVLIIKDSRSRKSKTFDIGKDEE